MIYQLIKISVSRQDSMSLIWEGSGQRPRWMGSGAPFRREFQPPVDPTPLERPDKR
jgi:hypothetical protein